MTKAGISGDALDAHLITTYILQQHWVNAPEAGATMVYETPDAALLNLNILITDVKHCKNSIKRPIQVNS